MNGAAFVTLAGKMVLLLKDEAARRTVISRSYYGAFHTALQLFRELNLAVDANHGQVWMELANAAHPVAQAVGRDLRELHSHRVAADYRLDQSKLPTESFAKECVESAQRILAMVETIKSDLQSPADKAAFIASITAFRAKLGRRV